MWQTLGYRLRRGHRQEKVKMITVMEFRYNNEIDRGYCKRKGDSVCVYVQMCLWGVDFNCGELRRVQVEPKENQTGSMSWYLVLSLESQTE